MYGLSIALCFTILSVIDISRVSLSYLSTCKYIMNRPELTLPYSIAQNVYHLFSRVIDILSIHSVIVFPFYHLLLGISSRIQSLFYFGNFVFSISVPAVFRFTIVHKYVAMSGPINIRKSSFFPFTIVHMHDGK